MRITRLFPILLTAFAAFSIVSCSDDDDPVTIVDSDAANVHEAVATYNSLTFTWDKVNGVNQYGYTLTDADGVVVADGVTDLTTVTIEELRTDAPYYFELRVYGEYSKPSYRYTINAATLPIQQLAAPEAKFQQQGNRIEVTWDAVPNVG